MDTLGLAKQNGPKMGFVPVIPRVKGGEVQKVHFWGPKGPLFGGPAPPKIDPGYGPAGTRLVGTHLNAFFMLTGTPIMSIIE